MCRGVNGDAPDFFNRSVNDRTNCISSNEILAARCFTHPIVGELSPKKAMYAARNLGHNSSITIYNINNHAIYKSEFVMLPLQKNYFTSSGQARRNTIGMHYLTRTRSEERVR